MLCKAIFLLFEVELKTPYCPRTKVKIVNLMKRFAENQCVQKTKRENCSTLSTKYKTPNTKEFLEVSGTAITVTVYYGNSDCLHR